VGEDRTRGDLDRALTVAQAADALGVSQDAVRKRIRRGTIQSERDESGRVYVYVPASETVHKTGQDTSQPQPEPTALTSEIESLREQVQWLRGEVQRKDAILLSMTEAMKALPPPRENAPESPQSAASPGPTDTPDRGGAEPQEGVQDAERRRWWEFWR
jgi:excisionase family DNA binding protein